MISEMDKMEEETYNISHTSIIFYDYMGTEYFDVGNGVAKDNERIYREGIDKTKYDLKDGAGRPLDDKGNPIRKEASPNAGINAHVTYEGGNDLQRTGFVVEDMDERSLPSLELMMNAYRQKLMLEPDSIQQVSEEALAKMDELIAKGQKAIESGDEDAIRYARIELLLHAFESEINAYKDDGITTSKLEDYVKLAIEQHTYLEQHGGTPDQLNEATRRMVWYAHKFNATRKENSESEVL